MSPKGERALFSARGDIFTVPVEKGGVRNLTKTSSAHDKFPTWSPDGKLIAFISDKSGEEEVWTVPQDGSAPPEQISTGSKAQRYPPAWSHDGKKILFGDKDGRVYVLTVATKQLQQIADAVNGQITDYDWSPKGNFVAYSMQSKNGLSAMYIWSAASNTNTRVTPESSNAFSPAWDPSGNYLYFLSDHEYAPQISTAEFNYATNRTTQVYALALRKDVKHPFPYESDEAAITEEKPAAPRDTGQTRGKAGNHRFRRDREKGDQGAAPGGQLRGPFDQQGKFDLYDTGAVLLRPHRRQPIVRQDLFAKRP